MKQILLNGRWEYREKGKGEWRPARVPGSIHGDLLRNGEIPDPFDRLNELEVQWVGRTDWEYRRTFRIPAAFASAARQVLSCEGLDTVADVFLNGRKVATTDNMFRRYEFDVVPNLRKGENEIRVVFHSAVREAALRAKHSRSALNECTSPVYEPNRPALRKAQYMNGWDWGPCLVGCGIWKDIRLLAYDAPRIRDSIIEQIHLDSGAVRLRAKAWLDVPAATSGRLAIRIDGRESWSGWVRLGKGERIVTAELEVEKPRLWMPAGQGQPHLYDVSIEWRDKTEAVIDHVQKRIGLRTVELVRQMDKQGESFFFRINGRPVFCKGANWIPGDLLLERMTREVYERDLRSAAAANMNMLRVWGGGIYENDAFYELCDELGLMVWQDFMFACALYPGEAAFQKNVSEEVRWQVRRLHDHPSIVLWCGDNEIEMIATREWALTPDSRAGRDYHRLVEETIPAAVSAEDASRPYWPSSPSSGGKILPNEPSVGDIHSWQVFSRGAEISTYESVTPRFVSEFGFQSFPCVETLKAVARPGDMNPCSPVMEHHQKHRSGNKNLIDYMARMLRMPNGFDAFCYATQVLQIEAIRTAVEHWRQLKPYCMGTLYWQLNDCWPVASWASVDYAGRWKGLHYRARRFFAPLLASSRVVGKRLEIWATSDLPVPLRGAWKAELWRLDGTSAGAFKGAWSLGKQASQAVARIPLDSILAGPEHKTNVIAFFELNVERNCLSAVARKELSVGDEALHSSNTRLFVLPKALELQAPRIRAKVESAPDGNPRVRLLSQRPALFVELSAGPLKGLFSENWMHLEPGREAIVEFQGKEGVDATQLRKALRVRSLFDSYQE